MPSHFISPAAAGQAIVVTIVLIVLSVIVSGPLGSLGFLGLITWLLLLGGLVVGLFLILRAGRPLAGAGAILTPLSIWVALYLQPLPFLWTGLFIIGAFLIAWGTRADTTVGRAWPITLIRVVVGWAWVSQGLDHFFNNWLPDGGTYLQAATTGSSRAPLWPLDPLYQSFLKSTFVTAGGQWASLAASAEIAFGLLLAMGAFTPVAAIGLLFISINYMLSKGFVVQAAYNDKLFFTLDLFFLITMAGLAYGLDAALRRFVPAPAAQALIGEEPAPAVGVQPEPAPA